MSHLHFTIAHVGREWQPKSLTVLCTSDCIVGKKKKFLCLVVNLLEMTKTTGWAMRVLDCATQLSMWHSRANADQVFPVKRRRSNAHTLPKLSYTFTILNKEKILRLEQTQRWDTNKTVENEHLTIKERREVVLT